MGSRHRYSIKDHLHEVSKFNQLLINLPSAEDCKNLILYLKQVSESIDKSETYGGELNSSNGSTDLPTFAIYQSNDVDINDFYITIFDQDPYMCTFLRGMANCWIARQVLDEYILNQK